MPFLVTGATGRTGAGVVRHLQVAGEKVRILVRDADKAKGTFENLDGIEIVVGAFDDNAVLTQAFNGVDVAFLALGSSPDQIRLEITAHVLRHTTVMRLLHAGINTIYLHADLEIK